MVFTIVMFFVLIAAYVVMFGVVKFAENVIAKAQHTSLENGTARTKSDRIKSP